MFWLIAFALAWAITLPMAADQLGWTDFGLPFAFAFLVGLAPAIAAFCAAARERRWRELWRNVAALRAPPGPFLLALLLPAACLAAPPLWAQLTGAAPPRLHVSAQTALFASLWLLLAYGEEIGWRGYALPRLVARYGFCAGSSVLGLAWCVWHYPRLLASPYIDSLAAAAPWIGLFSLQILCANYVICWLAARARYAVIVPALFHAGFNTVATIYPTAGVSLAVTTVLGVAAALLLAFSRPGRDARGPEVA